MKRRTTAIIYARVSTVRQADDGLPIASQVEQGQAKAQALGATVLRTFLDEGISGRSDRRPAFQDAVGYCASTKVDFFIVWNTSRAAGAVARHTRQMPRLPGICPQGRQSLQALRLQTGASSLIRTPGAPFSVASPAENWQGEKVRPTPKPAIQRHVQVSDLPRQLLG